MTAALGTLTFLVTMWLIVVVGAAVLEEGGAKIAAALKGHGGGRPVLVPMRGTARARLQQPMRARAAWRMPERDAA
ncbi:MAG: hypothetical protein ABIO80_07035 [Sphingomicrobium sp.]